MFAFCLFPNCIWPRDPNIRLVSSILLSADGINIVMNNDKAAGQVIFHCHVHIIPRHEGDGFAHWKGAPYKEDRAKIIQEQIKNAL